MAIDDYYPPVVDHDDTVERIKSLGNQVNLIPGSNMVALADALMSPERGRLRETKRRIRKKLEDFAGEELDDFWGTIINLQRLPGVEDVGDFVGDASYIERIQKMFLAGSMGVSEEAVRLSAEAGAGVPFRVTKLGPRIVLMPMEDLTPVQKAGALRTARRVAPASAILEIGPIENTEPLDPVAFHANDFYIGESPTRDGLTGPKFDGKNTIIGASADKWDRALEGTLFPGSGEPSQIANGGAWHTPNLGFGGQASLTLSLDSTEITSRATFVMSGGTWIVKVEDDVEVIHEERYIVQGWQHMNFDLPTARRSRVKITLTSLLQDNQDAFIKSTYVGLRLTQENRARWLQLGGLKGKGGRPELIAAPANEVKVPGARWISSAHPSPAGTVEFFIELSGVPVRVSALQFKTRTAGARFSVEYSSQNTSVDKVTDWTSMPGVYRLRQGRVKIRTTVTRHLKLVFTNLRPLLLKRYENGVI